MYYLILLAVIPAIWSAGFAVTSPASVQKMLDINENESPEEMLLSLNRLEKSYLLTSASPFLLILFLFFSEIDYGKIYCGIISVLAVFGIVFRSSFVRWKRLIIIESTAEMVIYCDILRKAAQAVWGQLNV